MHLVVGLGNPGTQYAGHRHNIGFMVAEAISAAFSFSAWSKKFHGRLAEGKIPFPLEGEGGPKGRMRGVEESAAFQDKERMRLPPSPAAYGGTLSLKGEGRVLILLPNTYMNDSGRAVQAACAFHKIPPENVIVLHDELELAPGKIRIKQGGGHGGHNGLKSIDAAIGKDYWRVRLGIGRPPRLAPAKAGVDAADYVLSNFNADEKKWLVPFLKSVAAHFPLLISGQESELMNRVTLAMKQA